MISDVYFPRINGVSTSIKTFRNELTELGHEVTLDHALSLISRVKKLTLKLETYLKATDRKSTLWKGLRSFLASSPLADQAPADRDVMMDSVELLVLCRRHFHNRSAPSKAIAG